MNRRAFGTPSSLVRPAGSLATVGGASAVDASRAPWDLDGKTDTPSGTTIGNNARAARVVDEPVGAVGQTSSARRARRATTRSRGRTRGSPRTAASQSVNSGRANGVASDQDPLPDFAAQGPPSATVTFEATSDVAQDSNKVLNNLIDDTEDSQWQAAATQGADGAWNIDGNQVTVDLAGTQAQRVNRVNVSAMLGPVLVPSAGGDLTENRFTALRRSGAAPELTPAASATAASGGTKAAAPRERHGGTPALGVRRAHAPSSDQ